MTSPISQEAFGQGLLDWYSNPTPWNPRTQMHPLMQQLKGTTGQDQLTKLAVLQAVLGGSDGLSGVWGMNSPNALMMAMARQMGQQQQAAPGPRQPTPIDMTFHTPETGNNYTMPGRPGGMVGYRPPAYMPPGPSATPKRPPGSPPYTGSTVRRFD